MAERYHVGNTPHNRQVVRDDQQGTVACIAVTAGRAEEIARALNLADAVPQRFLVQDDGTYRDSGSLPSLSDPLPPAECVDAAARQYLDAVYAWMLTEPTSTQPDPVPVPPWRKS